MATVAHRRTTGRLAAAAAASLAVAGAVAGCGNAALGASAPKGRVPVVAAEDSWGSIVAQVGGTRAYVQSIITSPGTDPHSYEPTAADAVRIARARLAVVNGIGYDPWATQLLTADDRPAGSVLDVGRMLGLHEGENPHQWYSPAAVLRFAGAVAADLGRLDPSARGYFARREAAFVQRGLSAYRSLISAIRSRFRGVPVGYSESIFAPLGQALGLRLVTPPRFARAIAEGGEVSPGDLATVERQAARHLIAIWVYNSQNETPEVAAVDRLARRAGIPIVTISETLSPASGSFQKWQVSQLRALLSALHRATGR